MISLLNYGLPWVLMRVFDKHIIFMYLIFYIYNNIISFKFLIQVAGPFVPLLVAANFFYRSYCQQRLGNNANWKKK